MPDTKIMIGTAGEVHDEMIGILIGEEVEVHHDAKVDVITTPTTLGETLTEPTKRTIEFPNALVFSGLTGTPPNES